MASADHQATEESMISRSSSSFACLLTSEINTPRLVTRTNLHVVFTYIGRSCSASECFDGGIARKRKKKLNIQLYILVTIYGTAFIATPQIATPLVHAQQSYCCTSYPSTMTMVCAAFCGLSCAMMNASAKAEYFPPISICYIRTTCQPQHTDYIMKLP